MPRITHRSPKPKPLSTYEELRNLSLAITVREKQVKLRRLEWDTQALALPHLTPMPGDGDLQRRKPLTQADLPAPRPPTKMPKYEAGMPQHLYSLMLDLYVKEQVEEERRDPYNKLASVTAQAVLEAAQAREDARQDKIREKLRAVEAKAEAQKNTRASSGSA